AAPSQNDPQEPNLTQESGNRSRLLPDGARKPLALMGRSQRDNTIHAARAACVSGAAHGLPTTYEKAFSRISSAARAGVTARPARVLAVLAPVNEVIDLHATRLAAARKRLPPLVMRRGRHRPGLGDVDSSAGRRGRGRSPIHASAATRLATVSAGGGFSLSVHH